MDRTLIVLAIDERIDDAVVVSARNTSDQPLRARLKVFGFDRETLAEGQTPNGMFHLLQWGKLGGKLLVLEPGASKQSHPIKVASDKTHVIVFGEGENLPACHCTFDRFVPLSAPIPRA